MTMTTEQPHDLGLDEAQIARDAAEFSRRLEAADVHRGDQADEQHRRDHQARFDEIGLPRGLPPIEAL